MARWECPNCVEVYQTPDLQASTPMHPCPSLSGVMAPFVKLPPGKVELPKGVRVVAVERGDYVNGEHVMLDVDGRPVMSVRTERADGSNDCHVFAPAATATVTTGD